MIQKEREEHTEHIDMTYGEYNYKLDEKLMNKKTLLEECLTLRYRHFLALLKVVKKLNNKRIKLNNNLCLIRKFC